MALLTETKAYVDQELGSPAPANVLFGGWSIFKGESAFEYDVGDFEVVAAFFGEICRYLCFTKQSLQEQAFTPEDVESCLLLIAPAKQWTFTPIPPRVRPLTPTRLGLSEQLPSLKPH